MGGNTYLIEAKTCFFFFYFLFSRSLYLSCLLIPLIAFLLFLFLHFPPLYSLPTFLFICLLAFSLFIYFTSLSFSSAHAVFSPLFFLSSQTVSSLQDHSDTTVMSHQSRRRLTTQSWGYRSLSLLLIITFTLFLP